MHDLITWINSYASHSIILAIGVLSLLESLAFVGILVPGVAMLATLCWLAGQQALSVPLILLSGFIGAVLGDWFSYLLGRHASHWIANLPWIKHHPHWLSEGKHFFTRYGGRSIFLGRFVGPIRAVIPFVAGSCAMPPHRFLTFNLISAACWAPVYLLPAYWLGQQAEELQMSWNIWVQLIALFLFIAVLFQAAHHQLEPGNWLYRYLHPFSPQPHSQLRTVLFAGSMLLVLVGCMAIRILHPASTLEVEIFSRMQSLPASLTPAIVLSTLPGDGLFLTLATLSTALLLRVYGYHRTALAVLAAVTITMLLNLGLKSLFDWPRPEPGLLLYNSASFPSGHSAGAAVLIASWAVLIGHGCQARVKRRIYLCTFAAVTLVALSRVLLGVHWPLDVVAGMTVGLFFAALLRWQMDKEGNGALPTALRGWLGAGIVLLVVGYSAWRLPAAINFYAV